MTAHDPNVARGGWMRWLGFGGSGAHGDEIDSNPGLPARTDAQRLEALGEITCFIMEHGLPITPFTLEVAHDIVTGLNPALSAIVDTRVADGHALTVFWLEDMVRDLGMDDRAAEIHALITRLETTIDEFATTTSHARVATTDYNSALEAHVDDLATIDPGKDVIGQITTLARDMLSRTREVALELTRSERDTRTLQRQLADARAEAEIDHLTGLPNRRAFEARFAQEYASSRENGEPLCVAFCDIDQFKRINDHHGHDAGDRVLRTVAQSLARISDDNCHVARHGGEEFVVLLRNRLIEEAYAVIDQAREALASRRLINRATDVPFGMVSFSAGVADVHAYADPREALRAADNALLHAKETGRNQVLKALPPD